MTLLEESKEFIDKSANEELANSPIKSQNGIVQTRNAILIEEYQNLESAADKI